MGKLSRDKGQRFERWVANQLNVIFGGCKRGFQSRDGRDAPDVICGPAQSILWIECKHHKQPNIRAAVRQAMACCGSTRWAVAVTKADNEKPLVTMPWVDFVDLLTEWWEAKQIEPDQ